MNYSKQLFPCVFLFFFFFLCSHFWKSPYFFFLTKVLQMGNVREGRTFLLASITTYT